MIKEGERSFDLEVMRGTSAACRLLIEFPYPFNWEGFEDETFGRRPSNYFKPCAPVGDVDCWRGSRKTYYCTLRVPLINSPHNVQKPYTYEGSGSRYADYEHQTSTLRLLEYRFPGIAGELRSLGANTTCGGDTVTNPSCGSGGSRGSCDDSRAP